MSKKFENPLDFFMPKKKTEKGGEGSGNWGHQGLAGVWGGSSPTKNSGVEPPEGDTMPRGISGSGSSGNSEDNLSTVIVDGVAIATEAELAELENALFNSWGFSYQPFGKNSPLSGYMVSYQNPTVVIPRDEYRREIMRNFVLENIEHFRNKPEQYFGGWISENKVFFDVSKNIQEAQSACLRAIDQTQKAIYHVDDGSEIFSISYLDNISTKLWTPSLAKKTFEIHLSTENPNRENFIEKYREKFSTMFGDDFITELEKLEDESKRTKEMAKKEIDPKDYKHEWTKKPPEEWTEQDKKENMHYQETRKPIRFQFGHDATEEDVDRFLDMVFGKKPKDDKNEKADETG